MISLSYSVDIKLFLDFRKKGPVTGWQQSLKNIKEPGFLCNEDPLLAFRHALKKYSSCANRWHSLFEKVLRLLISTGRLDDVCSKNTRVDAGHFDLW